MQKMNEEIDFHFSQKLIKFIVDLSEKCKYVNPIR